MQADWLQYGRRISLVRILSDQVGVLSGLRTTGKEGENCVTTERTIVQFFGAQLDLIIVFSVWWHNWHCLEAMRGRLQLLHRLRAGTIIFYSTKEFQDLVSLQWSVIDLQAYVNRYKSKCPNKGTCEQMSRIHNGGKFFLVIVRWIFPNNIRMYHWIRETTIRCRTERMQCFRHELLLDFHQIVLWLLVIHPFEWGIKKNWFHYTSQISVHTKSLICALIQSNQTDIREQTWWLTGRVPWSVNCWSVYRGAHSSFIY